MKIDHVDAYYYMGQNNVSIIKSEEIYKAFEDAKAQGKVSYLEYLHIKMQPMFLMLLPIQAGSTWR